MDEEESILLSMLCAAKMAQTARTDTDLRPKIVAAEMMVHGFSILFGASIEEARLEVRKLLEAHVGEPPGQVSRVRGAIASRRLRKRARRAGNP